MKISYILIAIILLSSCNINLPNSNVCRSDILPHIYIKNFQNPKDSDIVELFKVKYDGSISMKYDYQNSKNYNGDTYTNIFFNDTDLITPDHIYKFQYNNSVYFIYNIKLAESSYFRDCSEKTTYKINECYGNGYDIFLDPNCAIPVEQADKYFKEHVKLTMK